MKSLNKILNLEIRRYDYVSTAIRRSSEKSRICTCRSSWALQSLNFRLPSVWKGIRNFRKRPLQDAFRKLNDQKELRLRSFKKNFILIMWDGLGMGISEASGTSKREPWTCANFIDTTSEVLEDHGRPDCSFARLPGFKKTLSLISNWIKLIAFGIQCLDSPTLRSWGDTEEIRLASSRYPFAIITKSIKTSFRSFLFSFTKIVRRSGWFAMCHFKIIYKKKKATFHLNTFRNNC